MKNEDNSIEKHEFKEITPDLAMSKISESKEKLFKKLGECEKRDIKEELEKGLVKDPLTLLTGDERFWYYLGKASVYKPSNIKLTIIAE